MTKSNSTEARCLRLGVIGLGRAAAVMLPSLAAHPEITLVAAADPDAGARQRFRERFGGTLHADVHALLAQPEIDAVYIATPHQFHVEHAVAAAAAGKHFIVEKPLALTAADCRQIVEATRRTGVVSLVGHTAGFDPGVRKMRELIAGGSLGALRMINTFSYTDFLYRPRRPEELDSSLGGGIMFNQVPHQIDMIRVLAQTPVRAVRAHTGIWDPARPTEGALMAFIEFTNGVCASLVYSGYDHFDSDELCGWIGPGGRRKTPAHGSARRALRRAGSGDERAARMARGVAGIHSKPSDGHESPSTSPNADGPVHQPHFGMLLASCDRADLRIGADALIVYADEGMHEVALPSGRATPNRDAVVDDFLAAIRHGSPPLQDAAWGAATMDIVFALIRSAEERREITFDPPIAQPYSIQK